MINVAPVQQVSKGDQVLRQLRSLIIEGVFPVGTHLVEDSLAAQFDVSRGPIRDALRQLEIEGLLERKRRGVVVRGLTRQDVDELYSLRETLETLALRTAMARTTKREQWSFADDLVQQMRQYALLDRADEFAAADMEFHGQFYRLSEHSRLLSLWESYRPMFDVMLGRRNSQTRDLRPTAEAHADLLEAARGDDIELAVRRLQSHLLESRNQLLEVLETLAGQTTER